MKLKPIHIIAVLALGAAGMLPAPRAVAAGNADFSTFKLINDRNIFDPNRYPHTERHRQRPQAPKSAPTFALVGTMDYHKGMFAFFDGNSPDYRVVLQAHGVIAGYTVTDITLKGVTLKATGTNSAPLNFVIGDQMRLNGDTWEPAGSQGDFGNSPVSEPASSTDENNSAAPAPFADSGGAPSDILKRLMQQRAQEEK